MGAAMAVLVAMAVTEEVQLLAKQMCKCVCMLYIASGIYDN